MAKMKEVEIVIEPDGSITIEQIGWEGKNCQGAVDDLIKALGREVETKKTPEFYKQQKVQTKQKA